MRWSSLTSEAWRNIRSGTALAVQLAVLMGTLSAVVIWLSAFDVMTIADRGLEYRQSGAAVLIIQAPGAIDPAACEALNATEGVRAGALRRAQDDVVASALPGSSVPTYESSPGLAGILMAGRPPSGVGVLVSGAVAETLGGPAPLATRAGPLAVSGVYEYPADGRRSDLEFAIVSPTTSVAPFDECWAETWPQSDEIEPLLRTTKIAAESGSAKDAVFLQLNATHGTPFDGEAMFQGRATRSLAVLAVGASALIGFAATRLRKLELASARHSGVSPADQWLIVIGESTAWVLAVLALCIPVTGAFLIRALPGDADVYLQICAAVPVLVIAGGLTGATVAVLTSSERSLFRDFKRRR